VDTPLVPTDTPTRLAPRAPLRAIGRVHEVCFELGPGYGVDAHGTAQDHRWRIVRPDSTRVTPMVVLVAPDSQRVRLSLWAGLPPSAQSDGVACFEPPPPLPPRDRGRRYVRLELSADDSLLVRRVRWWSGERWGIL
jgi:hypothetical protein